MVFGSLKSVMAARGQGCFWSTLVIARTELFPGEEVGGTQVPGGDEDVLPSPSGGRMRQTEEGKLRIDFFFFFSHLHSEKEQEKTEGMSSLPGHLTPLGHVPAAQVYIATSARGAESGAS